MALNRGIERNTVMTRRHPLKLSILLILVILIGWLRETVLAGSRRQCVDVLCRLAPGSTTTTGMSARLFGADGRKLDECRACQQCTDNGYSVCTMPKRYDRKLRKFLWSRGCECAHVVPRSCEIIVPQRDPSPQLTADGRQLFQICYFSTIQKPMALHAVNTHEVVLVTLEPFWLDDYWRALRPENLTMHYEFVVKDFRHCHGKLRNLSPTDANQLLNADEREQLDHERNSSQRAAHGYEPAWNEPTAAWAEPFLCAGSLRIEMQDWARDYDTGAPAAGTGGDGNSDGVAYDYEYRADALNARIANATDIEPDEIYGGDYGSAGEDAYQDDFQPPSVKFERAVFVDARRLRLYYKFDVKRPRQLFMHQFEKKRVAVLGFKKTTVTSEILIFDLKPEVFGYGDTEGMDTTAGPTDELLPTSAESFKTPTLKDYSPLTSLLSSSLSPAILTTARPAVVAVGADTNMRWRFFRNAFLAAMLISGVTLLALIYAYRIRVHQRVCAWCGCSAAVADEDSDETAASGSSLGRKRRRKKMFRGHSYQSA